MIICFMYENGNGNSKLTTAKYWYEKACNLGNQTACDNYKSIK